MESLYAHPMIVHHNDTTIKAQMMIVQSQLLS
jgi:hypothetical protein